MSKDAALEGIRQDLHHPQSLARREALNQLRKLGADALPALPDLVGSLTDWDKDVRWTAAEVAGDIGLKDPTLVDGLMRLLHDPSAVVVLWAHYALVKLGVSSDQHFSALLDATQNPGQAFSAARALGQLGAVGLPALPRLRELLTHPDDKVRWMAGKSIERLLAFEREQQEKKPSRPESELLSLFERACCAADGNAEEHFRTAWEDLTRAGTEFIPLIEKMLLGGQLKEGEGQARKLAILIMAEAGVKGVPTIAKLSFVDHAETRRVASEALQKIGSEAADCLVEELHSRDPDEQDAAVSALALIGSIRPYDWQMDVISRLTRALRDADPQVPPGAAAALVAIGDHAIWHIEQARERVLRDGKITAVQYADWALQEIKRIG